MKTETQSMFFFSVVGIHDHFQYLQYIYIVHYYTYLKSCDYINHPVVNYIYSASNVKNIEKGTEEFIGANRGANH